jgi:putative flippase GtrA
VRGPGHELPSRLLAGPRGQFVRFCLVGASNTALTYLIFTTLTRLMGPWAGRAAVAQAVGYPAGVLWSYWLNSRWTFRAVDHARKRFTRFVGVQAVLMAASAALIGLLVDRLGLPATPAWFGVTVVITAINFVVTRVWVFGRIAPAAPAA